MKNYINASMDRKKKCIVYWKKKERNELKVFFFRAQGYYNIYKLSI